LKEKEKIWIRKLHCSP